MSLIGSFSSHTAVTAIKAGWLHCTWLAFCPEGSDQRKEDRV